MQPIKHALSALFRSKTRTAAFQIPVLCYHSWTADTAQYQGNDHIALEHDLRTLAARGYEIISIPGLVSIFRGSPLRKQITGRKLVAITFDDGEDQDFHDRQSSAAGEVKSFHRIMHESSTIIGQLDDGPRAVAFVIASPQCRNALGRDKPLEFGDRWWAGCAAGGVIGIANHSWDHVHDLVENVHQRDNLKGSFLHIDTFADAEGQIAEAHSFIAERTEGRVLPVFGYPYGDVPPFLRDEYFPKNCRRIGIGAAFSTAGVPVTQDSNLWALPRFVCGDHWHTPGEFEALLEAVESAA